MQSGIAASRFFRECQRMGYASSQNLVVVQFDREASQARDLCVAKNATLRAARPDPSLRKERLLTMTSKLHHYPKSNALDSVVPALAKSARTGHPLCWSLGDSKSLSHRLRGPSLVSDVSMFAIRSGLRLSH